MKRIVAPLFILMLTPSAYAQQHDHAAHHGHMSAPPALDAAQDSREWVRFPEQIKAHMLANMRDHLRALQEMQSALAGSAYDRAAELAETRLGMSSLELHGAHEASKYMPPDMRAAGLAMHRAASRFSIVARDAGATGDIQAAIGALSEVTGACVACHAGYRLR